MAPEPNFVVSCVVFSLSVVLIGLCAGLGYGLSTVTVPSFVTYTEFLTNIYTNHTVFEMGGFASQYVFARRVWWLFLPVLVTAFVDIVYYTNRRLVCPNSSALNADDGVSFLRSFCYALSLAYVHTFSVERMGTFQAIELTVHSIFVGAAMLLLLVTTHITWFNTDPPTPDATGAFVEDNKPPRQKPLNQRIVSLARRLSDNSLWIAGSILVFSWAIIYLYYSFSVGIALYVLGAASTSLFLEAVIFLLVCAVYKKWGGTPKSVLMPVFFSICNLYFIVVSLVYVSGDVYVSRH